MGHDNEHTVLAPDVPAIEVSETNPTHDAKARSDRLKYLEAEVARLRTVDEGATSNQLDDDTGVSEITVDDLLSFDSSKDRTRLLGPSRRFLCKAGSMVFIGESGIGKSSLMMHATLCWSAGLEFFGIQAIRPLKVLVIQRENDAGDLAELFQGALRKWDAAAPISLIRKNLRILHETERSGPEFALWMERKIRQHQADLVIADPLLSFAGCCVSDQKELGPFLRNMIQPALNRTGAAVIFVHHTGKPDRNSKVAQKTDSALKYMGLGSAELTNWARAVSCLRMVDERERVCEFSIPKRGDRAGLLDGQGRPTTRIYIKHGTDSITWERASGYDQCVRAGIGIGSGKNKPGRPSTGNTPELLRSILNQNNGSLSSAELLEACMAKGVSRTGYYELLREANLGGVVRKQDGRVFAQTEHIV